MTSRLSARTLAGTALALFALGGTAVASGLVPIVPSTEGAASTKAQIIEGMQDERATVQAALDAPVMAAGSGEPGNGPGYYASDNVTFVKNFREAADGVGGRVVGDYLYVTTTKDLLIYDISTPTEPVRVGLTTVDVEFENEQVPTDGKILGISGQTSSVTTQAAPCKADFEASRGCLLLFDVRDPANPTLVQSIKGAGDHTSTCLTHEGQTCAFMYGSSGSISDIRTALDEGAAPIVEEETNWLDVVRAQMPEGQELSNRAHHQTEVRPGVLLTATVPITLISTNAEDGGSPLAPTLLGVASHQAAPNDKDRFNHSVEWPNDARDTVMMAGGETNFQPRCGDGNGAFSTFTVEGADTDSPTFTYADQIRPQEGTYTDGNPPPGGFKLGCSVHWFEARPDFQNGGTVALASYENGTRFLDIAPDGEITEKGFFLPVDGSASAPHWASDGTTVYVLDYLRGLDVLTFDDGTFDPAAADEGTEEAPESETGDEGEEPGEAEPDDEDEPDEGSDCAGKSENKGKDNGKRKNCDKDD